MRIHLLFANFLIFAVNGFQTPSCRNCVRTKLFDSIPIVTGPIQFYKASLHLDYQNKYGNRYEVSALFSYRHLLISSLLIFCFREFLHLLKTWPRSYVLRRVADPVLFFTSWGIFLAAMSSLFKLIPSSVCVLNRFGWLLGCAPGAGLSEALKLIGGTISLLLVFRTNTAYSRFWGE